MKRKLDENNEPVPADPVDAEQAPATVVTAEKPAATDDPSFTDFHLDPRLLQAIAEQKYMKPTLVQQKTIPLILDGRDVLAKAKTGSGKTAAYLLPVLQTILRRKPTNRPAFTSVLILVPTRELVNQVHKTIIELSAFCARDITAVKLSDKVSAAVQQSLLSSSPDVVVATPARALANIGDDGALAVDGITHLIMDEADLLLSYGYLEDLQGVARALRKGVQSILMSATLTAETETLKGLFCQEPVVLDLVEKEAEGEGVVQYYVKCGEDEKFLLAYVIYKLRLIKGKSIIFVSDIDRCYRLKLFLEQFGIRSCILNSESPVNSRIHVVEEFNRNTYEIIIASDDHEVVGNEDEDEDEDENENENGDKGEDKDEKEGGGETQESHKSGSEAVKNKPTKMDQHVKKQPKHDVAKSKPVNDRPRKKQRSSKRDKEYGVARGIDFKNVACVVNFDLPTSARSYIHRIGRTARAGQTGMALSFVVPSSLYRKHMPTTTESAAHDERVLARISKQQAKHGKELAPYTFDMNQVDAFRYRMTDALRAVTRPAVREARTRELKQELIKSEKLKRHFEENPSELKHLRHDGELRAARTQAHLRHVPAYLLPGNAGKIGKDDGGGLVPFRSWDAAEKRKGRGNRNRGGRGGRGGKFGSSRRGGDPLKSFKARSSK